MARDSEVRNINGLDYKVVQLGAKQGRKVLIRLMKVGGAGLAGLTGEQGLAGVVAGLAAAVQNLSEEDFEYFCDTLSPVTEVTLADGKRPQLNNAFDDHFAGDYGTMALWLAFALEVNFSSFFQVLRDEVSKRLGPQAKSTT